MAHSMDQKPPKVAKIDNKNEAKVSFKVILLTYLGANITSNQIEVRRFVLPQDRCTSLVYLRAKFMSLFEKYLEKGMKVYWQDGDYDYVIIKSDEELAIAVGEMKNGITKLFVVAEH